MVAGIGLGVGPFALLTPFTRDRLTGESSIGCGNCGRSDLALSRHRHLVRDHPIFGVGHRDLLTELGRHTVLMDRKCRSRLPPDSPHNLCSPNVVSGRHFLGLALLVIAVLWVVYARRSWLVDSAPIAGACGGLAAYVVTLMTHFTSPGTTVTAAFLGGWVVSTQLPTKGLRWR